MQGQAPTHVERARGVQVGALKAAEEGHDTIPSDWAVCLTKHEELESTVDRILSQRVYFEAL